jgi:hypothetical protein
MRAIRRKGRRGGAGDNIDQPEDEWTGAGMLGQGIGREASAFQVRRDVGSREIYQNAFP